MSQVYRVPTLSLPFGLASMTLWGYAECLHKMFPANLFFKELSENYNLFSENPKSNYDLTDTSIPSFSILLLDEKINEIFFTPRLNYLPLFYLLWSYICLDTSCQRTCLNDDFNFPGWLTLLKLLIKIFSPHSVIELPHISENSTDIILSKLKEQDFGKAVYVFPQDQSFLEFPKKYINSRSNRHPREYKLIYMLGMLNQVPTLIFPSTENENEYIIVSDNHTSYISEKHLSKFSVKLVAYDVSELHNLKYVASHIQYKTYHNFVPNEFSSDKRNQRILLYNLINEKKILSEIKDGLYHPPVETAFNYVGKLLLNPMLLYQEYGYNEKISAMLFIFTIYKNSSLASYKSNSNTAILDVKNITESEVKNMTTVYFRFTHWCNVFSTILINGTTKVMSDPVNWFDILITNVPFKSKKLYRITRQLLKIFKNIVPKKDIKNWQEALVIGYGGSPESYQYILNSQSLESLDIRTNGSFRYHCAFSRKSIAFDEFMNSISQNNHISLFPDQSDITNFQPHQNFIDYIYGTIPNNFGITF